MQYGGKFLSRKRSAKVNLGKFRRLPSDPVETGTAVTIINEHGIYLDAVVYERDREFPAESGILQKVVNVSQITNENIPVYKVIIFPNGFLFFSFKFSLF